MLSNTEIIHSIPVDELTGAISVPIYQTSTFVQEAPGVNKGFDYARTGNPTRAALEKIVAELEGGSTGIAFSSGLAAIDAVIKLLKAGDEVVAVDDIYGGAYRLFNTVYNKFGIQIRFVDTTNAQNVFDAVTEKTKLVWIESPTNPTLKISDIEAIAKIAHANNALLCVDNTFASPALQNPIRLGADIVIHSATKYLGGHSDLIAGIAVAKDPAVGAELKYIQNASGAILAPFDSWLVIRGIETLNLRLSKHCETAQYIAERLQQHPAIDKVYYPGLKDHPNHDIAKKQASGFGGIISFTLKDDTGEAAVKFITSTKLFKLAESLGGAKSLCCHPATMTHKSIPAEKRRSTGISDSLVRLSVGLEEATDLLRDIDTALVHSNKNELVIA
jgi:cysteine-S-conjugate beta-lyase